MLAEQAAAIEVSPRDLIVMDLLLDRQKPEAPLHTAQHRLKSTLS